MGPHARNLFLTYFIHFSLGIVFGLDSILPLFFSTIGVTVTEWGILAAAYGLGTLLLEATWGILSDKYGRIIFMLGGLLLSAAIVPFYMWTAVFQLFLVLQFIRGGFMVMPGPAGRSFVSDTVSPKKLGSALALLGASFSLGGTFGSLIFSYVAERWTYAASFYSCSIILFVAGAIALVGLRKTVYQNMTDRLNRSETGMIQRLRDLRNASNFRMLIAIFSCAVLSFLMVGLVRTFIPVFASRILGLSTFSVGVTQAVFAGFSVIFSFIGGLISDRIGRRYAIMTGFLICLASSLSYAFATDIYQLSAITIGVAFGLSILTPSFIAALLNIVSGHIKGATIGLYGSFENLGIMIAPVLFALAWDFGPNNMFYLCSASQVIGVIIGFYLKETRETPLTCPKTQCTPENSFLFRSAPTNLQKNSHHKKLK